MFLFLQPNATCTWSSLDALNAMLSTQLQLLQQHDHIQVGFSSIKTSHGVNSHDAHTQNSGQNISIGCCFICREFGYVCPTKQPLKQRHFPSVHQDQNHEASDFTLLMPPLKQKVLPKSLDKTLNELSCAGQPLTRVCVPSSLMLPCHEPIDAPAACDVLSGTSGGDLIKDNFKRSSTSFMQMRLPLPTDFGH